MRQRAIVQDAGRHLDGPRGAVLLGLLALGAYAVQAQAWPFQRGRDAWDYLVYYLSLLDGDTPFPLVMLFRAPVTPIVLGLPLELGGALVLEIVAALLFAGAVVAWAAAARSFSLAAASVVGIGLLLQPAFALPYHEASSDMVASAGLALLGLVVTRTLRSPSTPAFAVVGAVVALLALTRQPYAVLLGLVVLPLVVPGTARDRLARAGALLALAGVPLLLFMASNGIRYGDITLSRQRVAYVPFYRVFGSGRIDPDAGPASRLLAARVEREVLVDPAYRRLDVDASTYFRSGSNYEAVRLLGLTDRLDGLDSDYALLRRASGEVGKHRWYRRLHLPVDPWWTLRSTWRLLTTRPGRNDRLKPARWPVPPPTRMVDGSSVPNPAALPPPVQAVSFGFLPCASDEIRRCIVADPSAAYDDPALRRRYAEVTARVQEWDAELGTGTPSRWLATQLDRGLRRLPVPAVWLGLTLVALVVRRPRGTTTLVVLLGAAGLVLAVHAGALGADPFYVVPVVPIPIVTAACAVLGARRVDSAGDNTAVPPTSPPTPAQ